MNCPRCGCELDDMSPTCPGCLAEPPLAPATGSASEAEISEHVGKVLDELRWLFDHGVKLHITPKRTGWNIKLTVPD